jgi:phenol hydroxylase P3 protein
MYVEENGAALFKDLERYGIRTPKGWLQACEGKNHISHQTFAHFLQLQRGRTHSHFCS